MNTVFVLAPNEGWIVDRQAEEFAKYNSDIMSSNIEDADVIWLLADWCVDRVPFYFLKKKKVITTIHHIVEEKFNDQQRAVFRYRDEITDVYHVFNSRVEAFVKQLTNKPIVLIKYWTNQFIWRRSDTRELLRRKHNLPGGYLCGSFQRDSEGHDVSLPKLEKGADLLADALIKIRDEQRRDTHVVLAGWRRNYVIDRLAKASVPYTYIELPTQETLNELYQTLSVYLVTARTEGGPQALLECALTGTPVISTPVGIAEQVLRETAIHSDVTQASPSVPMISGEQMIPFGFNRYRDLVNSL